MIGETLNHRKIFLLLTYGHASSSIKDQPLVKIKLLVEFPPSEKFLREVSPSGKNLPTRFPPLEKISTLGMLPREFYGPAQMCSSKKSVLLQ